MLKNMKWMPTVMAVAVLSFALGCSSGNGNAAEDTAQKTEQTAAGGEAAKGAVKDAVAEGQAQIAENPLLNWRACNEKAPDVFKAKFETTKGDFVVEVHRDWAPRGADRFYNLVKNGFYDECRFFRVIKGFMAQIGINGDPRVSSVWQAARIPDDPVKQNNTRGMVSFAMGGPNTRTTQIFINYRDNSGGLDPQGFSPFGLVDEEGMQVVDALYGDYGDAPQGPQQQYIQARGNAYLNESFPNLDYVKTATIIE